MPRPITAAFLVLALLSAGCSQGYYGKGQAASEKGDYDTALEMLYKAVEERPDDHRAWNEIGLAWYRMDSLDKAEEAFAASNRIKPNAISNLYLGMIFERTGELDKAIRVYGAAGNLQGDGEAGRMIRDRLSVLIDRKLVEEARLAVIGEDTLSVASIPGNSIAVINFDGSSLSPDLQPMAFGMAEFVAMDLSKVSRLKVLERVKINVILEELKLGESGLADPGAAPRVGKLLGSRKIVLGSVTGSGDSGFRLDGRLVDSALGDVSGAHSGEGDLDKFFEVEKKFVFALLDTLGVSISREERDAIEKVPTESFLAFMAFSKGLLYESRGMYDDASRAFGDAGKADPGFIQASNLAGKMEQAALYGGGGGSSSQTEGFEQSVVTSMGTGGDGMDDMLTANLVNSNFIVSDELYWNYGSWALAPPGGGSAWRGYGIIIIRGNLDAD